MLVSRSAARPCAGPAVTAGSERSGMGGGADILRGLARPGAAGDCARPAGAPSHGDVSKRTGYMAYATHEVAWKMGTVMARSRPGHHPGGQDTRTRNQ